MGRKKKYNTPEEKIEANRKAAMEYYTRNKEAISIKAKKRYAKRTKDISVHKDQS